MKAFYDIYRENDNKIRYFRNGNHVFGSHFHANIEIFIVNKGKYKMFADGNQYILKNGDIAFFDSYVVHGFLENIGNKEGQDIDDAVIIIPYPFTEKFNELKNGKVIKNIIIHDQELCSKLLELGDYFFQNENNFILESFSTLILSMLFVKFELATKKEKDDNILIKNLLTYTNEHFKEDISLTNIATSFGYSEAHLSRVFHAYFKESFPNYVNSLRLNYIKTEKLKHPDKKITSLLYEAGFKSIQSYYRNKDQV